MKSRALTHGPLIAGVIAACASGPQQLYPGPALPPDQVAVLEEAQSRQLDVFAIDGRRVFGNTWSLAPGEHEVWLKLRISGGAPGIVYNAWSYCRFRFEALPGSKYSVLDEVREGLAKGADRKVTLGARIVEAEGRVEAHPEHCSAKRPTFEN